MRSLLPALRHTTLALLAAATLPAVAQNLRDPAWEQLLVDDKLAELEAQARAKLKTEPADPQATLALGFAMLGAGTPAEIDATVPLAEACVARHPEASECHYMLGTLMGMQALRGGMLKAMGMAGRIRESFEKSVELSPQNFNHRVALMQFYLAAPAIAGGGSGKAQELIKATESKYPEQARCLRGMLAISDDKLEDAEKLLWAVQPGNDATLRSAAYGNLGQIAMVRLNNKQPAQAQPLLERLVQSEPSRALAFYGLGRMKAETGAPQEALRYYTQARSLRGQHNLPLDYREALAWLLLGDNAKAKALLQRFIGTGRGNPKNLDDAKERLATLGQPATGNSP